MFTELIEHEGRQDRIIDLLVAVMRCKGRYLFDN
jgi:hypothetical protein